jgi:hypothetical protein
VNQFSSRAAFSEPVTHAGVRDAKVDDGPDSFFVAHILASLYAKEQESYYDRLFAPEHARLFETGADYGFASGLNHA